MKRRSRIFDRFGLALGVALTLAPAAAAAQAQGQAGTPTMAAVPANYQVGAGDVLNVIVLNDTDLNETATVDPSGMIPLPERRTNVPVAGKTVLEIDREVEQGLVQAQLEVAPRVSVSVAAVESKPVSVSGSVRAPGQWQAAVPFSLLDGINRAGGTDDPGAIIEVKKPTPSGGIETVFTTTLPKLLNARSEAENPLLRGGELVSVLPGGRIFVGGAVNHPGTIPVDASEQITVKKAYALAGEETKVAALDKAVIFHKSGEAGLGPQQPVNVKAILKGKAPDVVLQADDFLYIPTSGLKALANGIASGAQSALTLAASTTLTGIH